MRKKRGYKRDTPQNLVRDYKLFAIACEGSKREPDYFNHLASLSPKIKIDIIETSDEDKTKSAPKYVLDRAVKYIEKEGLIDEDELWFILDKDKWSDEQLRKVFDYCKENANWGIAISNPCFEVWLYFHKKADISESRSNTCSDFKTEISTFEIGGYQPKKFIEHIQEAVKRAKQSDSNKTHFLPKPKETKVYQLVEKLFKFVPKNDLDKFLNRIKNDKQ